MKSVPVYIFLVVLLRLHQKGASAVSSLEVSSGGGTVIDGMCPDTTVSLTCSHNSTGDLTRWAIGPPIVCSGTATHSSNPSNTMCGSFIINMVSAMNQPTRTSTLVLPVDQSLNGAVVTCYAGGSTYDPQAGNLTIHVVGPPSTPTVDSMEYSVVDSTTGRLSFLVSSSGTISASVVGGNGSVVITENNIAVTGLSYTESHTIRVVATSDVCPGVNNSITDVPVIFNIRSLVLTQPTGFVDCSNPSLPIWGSWSLMEGVQSSNALTVQLTPPLIGAPTITYTSAGRNDSGVFVPDSSYQLTDTVENDVYTFTVTVTNAANSSSEVSEAVVVIPFVVDESTLETMNCLTFSLGRNCASEQSGKFVIWFQQGNGVCRDLVLSDFSTSTIQLMPQSTCAPVASSTNLCYRATLMYNGIIIIDTQTNFDFNMCSVTALSSFLGSGVSMQLDGEVTNGNVSHLTTATLNCTSAIFDLIGSPPQITCIDGTWKPAGLRSCTFAVWLIVVIVFIILALACAIGVVCGVLTARYLTSLLNGLTENKCWAILTVVLLGFLFCFGVGVLFYICCCKRDSDRKSIPRDAEKLTQSTSSPPPPDSLYAGTENQYAMVDRKGKKNTKPKPTPPDKSTGKLVEEATKPNSSQLPQELYSEVFNALPKGMAPKVVRNGTKN